MTTKLLFSTKKRKFDEMQEVVTAVDNVDQTLNVRAVVEVTRQISSCSSDPNIC